MEQRKHPLIIFISGLAGLMTAIAIVATLYQDQLNPPIERGITLALLTLGSGFLYFMFLPPAWKKFNEAPQPVKYWGTILAGASAIFFNFGVGHFSLIAFLVISFSAVAPRLFSFQKLLDQKQTSHFVLAWALGGSISFLALGFFQNFYPSLWEFFLLTILLNSAATLAFGIVIEHVTVSLKNKFKEKIVSIAVMMLCFTLIIMTIRLLVQFPTLFLVDFFLPDPRLVPAFLGLTILSQSWTAILLQKLDSANWRSSPFIIWIKRNLPGLLLASAISASTYLLATALVSKNLALADNYFDTDSPIWVSFLTASADQIHPMRAVHPFALMILRPPVWLLSLLLNGDKFHAALILNALAGGVCVLLAWKFFKQRTDNTTYALLLAALLGFSNSHLLLGTLLESYIFSAAALITSIVLLQNKNTKLVHIVPVGLITFGITITNFIQTCITFLFTQWDIKKTLQYIFVTIALATVLTFAQTSLQPNSQPFYIISNLGNEGAFKRDIIDVPLSETVSRVNVITRTITLFSLVAPRPLILLEEIGCSTPCFNTIRFFRGKYQYASYIGFGSWLARAWFALLFIAALIFIWNLIRSPKNTSLQTALALNLLFNFVLHMNYGDDPMLYSPNWTYALIFFFGISLEKFADKKWIQIGLLIFLTALLFNNIDLFRKILDAILPFFG